MTAQGKDAVEIQELFSTSLLMMIIPAAASHDVVLVAPGPVSVRSRFEWIMVACTLLLLPLLLLYPVRGQRDGRAAPIGPWRGRRPPLGRHPYFLVRSFVWCRVGGPGLVSYQLRRQRLIAPDM